MTSSAFLPPTHAQQEIRVHGGSRIQWKECVMNTFIRMLKDESGASAAEYALILAIVGAAIAFAAVNLGSVIANSMNHASDCIKNPPTTGGGACG